MYDLIIIGGGPAGVAAGIYGARKKIKILLISDYFGGQSIVASNIQNFIGIKSISGIELSRNLEEQLKTQEDVEVRRQTLVSRIEKKDGSFIVKTNKDETFETKTILLALGSCYKNLNMEGEEKFKGRGVFYCATCDAPLMKNKIAAVIGGGNYGVESALDLLSYASKIYILERNGTLKADKITQEKARQSDKIEIINHAQVKEIFGEKFVKGLKYENMETNEVKELAVDGVFVSIGYRPNSDLVKNLVELDKNGAVIINSLTQKTSVRGIWAAGDITNSLYHQNNIAIGDGIKAVLNIHDYLKTK